MPLPSPRAEETTQDFIDRCMIDTTMQGEYPNRDQRLAVCTSLEKNKKATYSDYPESAVNNAKRALEIREETGNPNDCGTQVGWARANQLANKEALSEDTIKRMASFNRHRQNSDGDPKEDCGALMWLAWGGTSGIDWAIAKSEEIDNMKEEQVDAEELEEVQDKLPNVMALMRMAMDMYGEGALPELASRCSKEPSDMVNMLNGKRMPEEKELQEACMMMDIPEKMLNSAMELDGMKREVYKSFVKSKQSEKKAEIDFHVENVKQLSTDAKYGYIKGYGSIFGNVDLGGDIVEKGAFKRTLQHKGNKVPFLQDHKYDIDNFLGVITAEEDDRGLKADIEVNLMTDKGREFYYKAKQCQEHDMPMGLSIGYDIVKSDMDKTTGVLKLKELRLNEISATMFPMNEMARITDVKSKVSELETELTQLKSLLTDSRQSTPDELDLVNGLQKLRDQFKN